MTACRSARLHGHARGCACSQRALQRALVRHWPAAPAYAQHHASAGPSPRLVEAATRIASLRPLPPPPAIIQRSCVFVLPVHLLQPRYQEVVDRMVGQLLRLLWEQERGGNGRYRWERLSCMPQRGPGGGGAHRLGAGDLEPSGLWGPAQQQPARPPCV